MDCAPGKHKIHTRASTSPATLRVSCEPLARSMHFLQYSLRCMLGPTSRSPADRQRIAMESIMPVQERKLVHSERRALVDFPTWFRLR